jgi:hypothetical protein
MNTPLAWRPEAGGCRVELVGLVPQSALLDSALHYLQVMGFTLEDTVEQRLDSILGTQLSGAQELHCTPRASVHFEFARSSATSGDRRSP